MQRTLLAVTSLALAALSVGCQGPSKQQRLWLAEGERAYEARRYEQAIRQLTQFIGQAADQPEVARALYVRALAYAHSDQRLRSRSDLVRCAGSAGDDDLRWRAYTVLGTLDYEDGQWATAARSYAAAADLAPNVPPTDTVLFRLGVCLERSGRWGEARAPYQRIVDQFPARALAAAAQRRLQINADHFAVQCGVFSQRKNAESFMIDLERQGLAPRIRREPRNGVPMYVVLVGHCAKYEQALQELARVKGYVPKAVLWP